MIVRGELASQKNESGGSKERAIRRLAFLVAILIGLILVVVVQLFRLQIFQGIPGSGPVVPPEVASHRGLIIDCRGYLLALNIFEYDVSAAPNVITDTQYVANHLSPILALSPPELVSLLDPEKPYVLLEKRVSQEVAEAITLLKLTGIYLKPKLRRKYPGGGLLLTF